MAEGGSPPLQVPDGLLDPGGLHIYTMNGGSHKMAELIPESQMDLGINNLTLPELGMYDDNSISPSYSMNNGMTSDSYIQVEPLGFNTQCSTYEELKRPASNLQAFFSNMDMVHNSGSIYGPGSGTFPPNSGMFKHNMEGMGGYVEMLGNSESLMNIKQEKLDYSDHMNVGNNHSPEMSFPQSTCIADWTYYNSNNFQESHNHNHAVSQGFGGFVTPSGPIYHNSMMNNTHPEPLLPLHSNADIHNQSKKITQSILGTDWTSETMYKSRLYQNSDVESNSKKRKVDSEKATNKSAKSRRKKGNDIGGHSKTVASILLSDNSGYKTENKPPPDVLDSSERNALVTTLMDSLRTTVQYESFCLSFPRTKTKDNAFYWKVAETAKLVDSVTHKGILSEPLPENFVLEASKYLKNFHSALKISSKKKAAEDDNVSSDVSYGLSVDQVEEHLPHSMFWVIKLGDQSLTVAWEGQFVAAVNPVKNLLSISVFQFHSKFSDEGTRCLQESKMSKALASDIIANVEQFEVSRQLRADINLGTIEQIYLYTPLDELHEGCLILEVTDFLKFYQRWLHTSAEDKNKWRQRSNFINKSNQRMHEVICLGGLVVELKEVLAQMLSSCPQLQQKYQVGVNKPFHARTTNGFVKPENSLVDKKTVIHRSQKPRRPCRKPGTNVIKLRSEVIEVLKSHGIATMEVVSSSSENEKEDPGLEIQLDDSMSPCFSDYVNYTCDSATELNSILQQKVLPRNNGFYENDFDLSLVPGSNIDTLTVGELISNRCSEVLYFSFCSKDICQVGYDKHCSSCRKCRTVRYWHCDMCSQCSQSRSICEFCGHLRDDHSKSVVKPLSVFKSQVAMGSVSSDDCKKEWLWSLNLPDDDILTMNPPYVEYRLTEEYNASNAMMDQLGLLNPVGFLLGQPLVGARRKHRQHKPRALGEKLPPVPRAPPTAASGCSLQ